MSQYSSIISFFRFSILPCFPSVRGFHNYSFFRFSPALSGFHLECLKEYKGRRLISSPKYLSTYLITEYIPFHILCLPYQPFKEFVSHQDKLFTRRQNWPKLRTEKQRSSSDFFSKTSCLNYYVLIHISANLLVIKMNYSWVSLP